MNRFKTILQKELQKNKDLSAVTGVLFSPLPGDGSEEVWNHSAITRCRRHGSRSVRTAVCVFYFRRIYLERKHRGPMGDLSAVTGVLFSLLPGDGSEEVWNHSAITAGAGVMALVLVVTAVCVFYFRRIYLERKHRGPMG
ncbi:uncharacterized protein CEXT_229691 [Caerostris extrusa]|uniref:Uncharacterized protein n=1 Tax=Caerostris extrusa TaxID=172846 RepID=A0AAV4SYX3_CAEEX|nr:uncharacterized protein CEXT_229691 [Caerostris extrusa]